MLINDEIAEIDIEARKLCHLMLEYSCFLEFTPSLLAAASLLLAIKMRYFINLDSEAEN